MNDSHWVLFDTKSTGLSVPLFVLEIGAQRMRGWTPEGPSFHRLLNQNQDILPDAARMPGYTRELLERDGEPAEVVYEAFAEYAGDLSLVSYDLQYDLDQVLLQGQFLFEPPTGPVLVQPIDRQSVFRSTQPNLMASWVSG